MEFSLTPEEAQTAAMRAADHLTLQGFQVEAELPFAADAPYRTTLLAKQGALVVLIEAQSKPSYEDGFRDLVRWLATQDAYCEVSIVTYDDSTITMDTMEMLKHDGVGVLSSTASGLVTVISRPRNPALLVTLQPALALGRCQPEIRELVSRFNEGDRKAALRDLCEIVERETKSLLSKASRKHWVSHSAERVAAMDWSNTIDALAAARSYVAGKSVLVDDKLKTDLHSFRGARNLVNHPVGTKRAELKRERQFPERMLMGARLTGDLLSLARHVV